MLNIVVVEGRLVRDIEIKEVGENVFASVPIASEDFKRKASFIELKLYGKTAENAAKYTRKGSLVIAQGRMVQESWNTPDGKKISKVVVYVDHLEYQDKKKTEIAQTDMPTEENGGFPF